MSHRSLRSPLVPISAGLAAAIAVFAVTGSGPAFGVGAGTDTAAATVRAQEWWLAGLSVTQAWRQTEGAGVTVAVLGTGVAARHPDLAGQVATGPDDTKSGRTPDGPFWGIDGTQVAAIIAGHGHGPAGGSGIVGVAPAAKILSVRVTLEFNDPLNVNQAATRRLPGAIATGITYAVNHGARVIDLPLDPGTFGPTGAPDPAAGGSPAEQAAVSYALRKSVVLVAPAGDDGESHDQVNYPAAYTGVIAVGAVSRNGRLAPFSSRRSYVSVTAPGAGLPAAVPPASYATISSTSTASGIVAGTAALLLSKFPHLTVAQVTQALTKSTSATAVTDGAAGPGTGYGTVNAARAITLAADISAATKPPPHPTPPPATPHKAPRPAHAAPRPATASAFAGSLVRDIVAALAVLIVLVIVLLLIMSSRRKRVLASSAPGTTGTAAVSGVTGAPGVTNSPEGPVRPRSHRGQHGPRRTDQNVGPVQARRAAQPPRFSRPPLATPAVPPVSWQAPGSWQGGGVGEIAQPPAMPPRPTIAPVARPAPASRSGDAGTSAGPPWAPAPEPGHAIGPFPIPSASSFPLGPGRGIRIPPDVTASPTTMTGPAAPRPTAFDPPARPGAFDPSASFEFPASRPSVSAPSSPPPASASAPASPAPGSASPAFPPPATDPGTPRPATGPDLGAATIPGFPRLNTGPDTEDIDVTRPISGLLRTNSEQGAEDQDITRPFPAADPRSRRGLGFAAAPVATEHPDSPDGSSAWDLAATDVFPAASAEPPADPDDDAPGASES